MTAFVTSRNLSKTHRIGREVDQTETRRVAVVTQGGGMRKADIADEIFKQVGISKNEAADIVEFVLNMLKSVLQKGESVKIAGFGNFVVRSKGARKGRNPRTGEEIGITPRRVVTFRPSQVFKKYVNS
ncbi:MAG: integration host factor subunit alpha [Nitrospira sp.]